MDWILKKFESFGPRVACIEAGRTTTFAELVERIRLQRTKLPSDRAVLLIEDEAVIDGLTRLLAIAGSSHIALPLPPSLSETERNAIMAIAQPEGESGHPLYDQLKGSGLILFSSGTSGQAKGMLHDLPALLNRYETVKPRNDRTLQLLLIDHIGGLDSALRCLCAGSTLIVPEARTADAAGQAIEAHQVTVLPASPTFLNLMLIDGIPTRYNCDSLEVIAYGAEAMPENLLRRLSEAFPQARLQQKFGTSETGAIQIRSKAEDSLFFSINDTASEWKVVDGELWLKSPSRIIGYLNADDSALEAAGWYRTGDLVEEDAAGHLRIIGRRSEIINIGGQKVHPSEVEAVLNHLDGIESCRVFGESDPITGQHVACEIVSQNEQDLRSWKRSIRQHCRDKLAPWKIPSSVKICAELRVTDRLKRN